MKRKRNCSRLIRDLLLYAAVLIPIAIVAYFMRLTLILVPVMVMLGAVYFSTVGIISLFTGENMFNELWANVKRRFR